MLKNSKLSFKILQRVRLTIFQRYAWKKFKWCLKVKTLFSQEVNNIILLLASKIARPFS